ncbi:hypothetical protein P4O66_015005 [Electrophorus voltai]|uniref:Uncharacterized protein n=1 Tax=Electrophorus voltai TaxID=2609070 RepID=A0AAD9DQ61_9TELE|nr:hypothetical protein P4O66_015005 [Electrophorus voltai]
MEEYINDGDLYLCIDYLRLKEGTVKNQFPMPLLPSAPEQLCNACVYTTLDLRSTYNLIYIWERDGWKTAFSTTTGHYKNMDMHYGPMLNIPSVFRCSSAKCYRTYSIGWMWPISKTY